MIICPKCDKENQDHYKFCLGCGAELPRESAPRVFSPAPGAQEYPMGGRPGVAGVMADPFADAPPQRGGVVPAPMTNVPHEMQQAPQRPNAGGQGAQAEMSAAGQGYGPGGGGAIASAPALVAAAPYATPEPSQATGVAGPCAQCGHVNAPGVRFCISCGYNLAVATSAPPPAPPAAAAAPYAQGHAGTPHAVLTALRADKSEVGAYSFTGTVIVGRDTGGIFAGDSYLSPRHATFTLRAGRLFLRDEGSLNGTFVKLQPEQPVELRPNDVFRIGQEIIRFEPLTPQPPSPDGVERLGSPSKGYVGRIALVIGRDVTGNALPVPEAGVHLGRERGDILFPEDGYVSGLHCRIRVENGRVMLTDLGSSNGTFVKLTGERELRTGDEVLMGQQLFRVTF